DGIERARKYYEENMKMFGELRLVRAMTDEQIEIMRDPKRAPTAKLPKIEDAVAAGGFLTGNAQEGIDHLKAAGAKYPALGRISVSLAGGGAEAEGVEQMQRFGEEVVAAVKEGKGGEPGLGKVPRVEEGGRLARPPPPNLLPQGKGEISLPFP